MFYRFGLFKYIFTKSVFSVCVGLYMSINIFQKTFYSTNATRFSYYCESFQKEKTLLYLGIY